MTDGTEITKQLGPREELNFSGLKHIPSTGRSSIDKFLLKDLTEEEPTFSYMYKRPQIEYNNNTGLITYRGSLPYLINGNNFENMSLEQGKDAIDLLSNATGLDFHTGDVKMFEYGVIVKTELPYKEYSRHYIRLDGMGRTTYKQKNRYTGLEFRNNDKKVKIYDAGQNVKKLPTEIRKGLIDRGIYNPKSNYLKVEMRYERPLKCFDIASLKVKDLLDEVFIGRCQDDLITTYKNIKKIG